MTRKPKNADSVDTLINFLPRKNELPRFEEQEMLATMPPNGKDLFKDLRDALFEKDIIQLRTQLHEIAFTGNFADENQEAPFDLAEKVNIPKFLEEWECLGLDILPSRKPLPRIHVHNHHRAETENMHQFYMEQIDAGKDIQDLEPVPEADEEFPDLENALRESDIMELRETLAQISGVSSFTSFNAEEIDNYMNGNMTHAELEAFEAELYVNSELSRDIELYAELDEALHESNIMELREKLEIVMQSQHSTLRSLKEVDEFVNGELPENEMDAFLAEMAENDDLKAEVNLSKNLHKAFLEKDIHQLRVKLHRITKEIGQQSAKAFIMFPEKHKKLRRTGTYAAVFLVLIGLSSVIWGNHEKDKTGYEGYFNTPLAVSSFRSADAIRNEDLNKGFEFYNKSEYVSALLCFEMVLQTDHVNPIAHYWAGLTNQQIQHYPDALHHFQQVIDHQNNLFVEQAEWFRIWCTLKSSGKAGVGSQLEAIIDRKGYYYKDALDLRSKLQKDD